MFVIMHLVLCLGNRTWSPKTLNQCLLNKGIKGGERQYFNSIIIKRFPEQAASAMKPHADIPVAHLSTLADIEIQA